MPRDIIFVHGDVFVLAGNLRAMLMLADLAKHLGYHIVFMHTDVRPREDEYWSPGQLREYHPVKHLEYPACRAYDRPCGDFMMVRQEHLRVRLKDWLVYDGWGTYVLDEARYYWLLSCCPPARGIRYIHYPDRPAVPRGQVYAFNSRYTLALARAWWGVEGHVMHPPLWTDMYRAREWDERDIDIIFFGQLYRVKGYNLALRYARRGLRVAVVGADVRDWAPAREEPRLLLVRNATFREYSELLSRSKVYIHARPGEHFGITITEAMASGTPVIVHRSGGQWIDVVERGLYGQGWETVEELDRRVASLLGSRRNWEEWSLRALQGALRFDARRLAGKWRYIIEEARRANEEARRRYREQARRVRALLGGVDLDRGVRAEG